MDAVDIDTAEDAHEDAIEETVPEVCRVCLLGHMIMRDLFVENDLVSLSTKAMSFASVKMLPEDGLPTQVCCDCADKLEAAYEFKLQVEQADNVLRQRYDALNIKEELFFNEVEVHLEAERSDDVHTLDVDDHYQATVDSLNAVEANGEKPTLLKDHLALLEVEKLAKQQNVLEAERKHESEMNEETNVSAMLQANDDGTHYLDENEGNVVELVDCNDDYRVKAEGIQDHEGITVEEHNYIMQEGYRLSRNDNEEIVTQESVDSVDNETVNYLSMISDDIRIKENSKQPEILNTENNENSNETNMEKSMINGNETRRSKRKLNKRRGTSDEDNYFENLNLSSRLKKTQLDKNERMYFLCYVCDKKFVSKEILKEHMHSHEEVRRALSLKKIEKMEKSTSSPTKQSIVTATTTTVPTAGTSGKKANKCPYCGKEYLYVISFNKHLKQHEKNKDATTKEPHREDFTQDETEDSSDFVGYDETRLSETNSRVEDASNDENENTDNDEDSINVNETNSSRNKRKRASSLRNETYSCEKCMENFTNKRQQLDHACLNLSIFKCNTCDREFDELEKLRRHRTEHVVDGVISQQELEDNVYKCEFDQESQNDDNNEIYDGENFAEARNEMEEVCNQRNHDNANEDRLDRVVNESPWRLEVESGNISTSVIKDIPDIFEYWNGGNNYKCNKCTITCSSKKSLIRHLEFHQVDSRTCKICKTVFTNGDNLQEHIDQQHGGRTKVFKCTDCGKTFGHELTLRNHLFATNHKTYMHGQRYDPNKRIKRVAAKAAQRIIDKIKTENDMEYYEEDDEVFKKEKIENTVESDESKMNDYRWSRKEDNTQEAAASGRKNHRNRSRRYDYECESCGRKCSSKQSLTKHMDQHRNKDERSDTSTDKSDKLRKNNINQGSNDRTITFNNQRVRKSMIMMKRDEPRTEDETENDETTSDFESGLDWPMDNHECPTCKKKYSTKKSLLRHQLLHEEPNFECDICNVKFYRKDKLKSHYDKCSEKNPDQVRKCNICGDTFEHNEILKEHRSRHVDEGILTEEDLREIEPGTDERKESTKVARKRRTDIVGLECTECNKRYTSRKGLLRHIQVHEGKKYLCDICPKKFYRREHLKIHVAKHNMVKPYKCPRCTKRFIKEEQLSNHLSKHDRTFKKPKETDTSKRFLCEICSKSFTQSTTLVAHLRAHNGIKPYVCEVCARPFTTNAYLKMHMRTHTQERPYSCQYCMRAFARADTLANHLTSHTGEAKYHCKYCPKNFRRLKSLKEHVFIHTGQRPYACPTCDRRFNNNGSRYAHSKRCKQNLIQNPNRGQNSNATPNQIVQNTVIHPIRLHQLIAGNEEHETHMELVKSQNIKTITIARSNDQLPGHQMMQHQEILMPLILPLTVTLADVDEEVILPEGTKIYTTA